MTIKWIIKIYRQLVLRRAVLFGTFVFALTVVSSLSFISPSLAYAAGTCTLPTGQAGTLSSDNHTCCPAGTSPNNNSCLFAKYINPAVQLLSAMVGVVVVIAIIVGGIEFSASAGDPQKAATGKKHIINALIGLVAYLFLFTFLQFILPGGLFNG